MFYLCMKVKSYMKKATEHFQDLLDIMDELREKCPWDRKQTMESIRHLTIEETYELSEAILKKDMLEIKKELGDLLLHIVFYAKIATEKTAFDISKVIETLNEKLIRRHPHVYGKGNAENEDQVKTNWEQIKMAEGKKSALSGVPKALPAMIKAYRIQEKARGVGFDWDHIDDVKNKVFEELDELMKEILNKSHQERIEEEFGDLFFALINYARFFNINPEDALEKTNRKFISRFSYIEEQAEKKGKQLKQMTLFEMDEFWNEAKKNHSTNR